MPKTFEHVDAWEPPEKPRDKSMVSIRGPYYSTVTYRYLEDLLDMVGWSVDGLKYSCGVYRQMDSSITKKFIKLCHSHDMYVSTGGFVERVIVQGKDAVDTYFEECQQLGFDVVEISSGLAHISLEDQLAMADAVRDLGMTAKPEISFVFGAGAGVEKAGYELEEKGLDHMKREVEAHLDAGAEILMVESEGLTELPEDKSEEDWRKDVILALIDEFGYEKFMFEASDPKVFKWYLKEIGRDVNLFIDHSQILEFNGWRMGIWGDPDIWEGKEYSYL